MMHFSQIFTISFICAALGEHHPDKCAAGESCDAADEDAMDTQVLMQTSAQGAGNDLCPSDASSEATQFWEKFFKDRCDVAMDDVPAAYKTDIGVSTAFHLEQSDSGGSGCRIVTSFSDIGGSIAFDTAPGGAQSSEGWTANAASATRQMNDAGAVVELKGNQICEIFHDGIPRIADIPTDSINEVFDQIKADFNVVCPNMALDLTTDTSDTTVSAKRSMADSSGKSIYSFELLVSAPGKDAMVIAVEAEEDPPSDPDATVEASNKAFEDRVKREAAKRDHDNAAANDNGNAFLEYGDVDGEDVGYAPDAGKEEADVASYIQSKLRIHSPTQIENDGQRPEENTEEDPALFEEFKAQSNVAKRPAPALGKLRVLDDRTSPLLCCLCSSCNDMNACSLGADGLTPSPGPPSFIEDDDEAKIREQEELYPEFATNNLLEVGTAGAGSHEEHHPPLIPGDVVRPADFRVRAEPDYGDNFHALILPKRTAEDHKQVWAQSRALIEEGKNSNVSIDSYYHYYDRHETAQCYQAAYNQGKCGSCWAFASLGALEKQICLRAEGDVRASLSREMLVRCSEQNNGCQGGNADKAYEDLMEIGGVFSSDCLPYQGTGSKHCPVFAYSWFGQGSAGKTGKFARIDQELQKSCNDHTRYSNRPPQGREWDMPFRMMYEARFGGLPDMNDARLVRFKKNFAKARSRDRVPSWWLYGQDAMKTAVVKYGSIYASFKVRNDFKDRACADGCWPPGTVYGEEPTNFKPATCGCGKGHAIHIIGFGEDIQETGRKVPYWLIENSWGDAIHGDVFGEDAGGVKGFGKDPFTEEHPMGIEDECLLAGWAYSSLPKTGGCGGNANVNLRNDVKTTGGVPDGMTLAVMVDGVGKANWTVAKDSTVKIATTLRLTPGAHNITFLVYAKDHPKQQSFPMETYGIKATSLRCRGRGYMYSFTKNDTKAHLSWGRKTRKELKAEADALIPTNNDPEYLYAGCPESCRTGRYSWVKPCVGLLTQWGSCYTDSWALQSSYMLQSKRAMCTNCTEMAVKVNEKAYATRKLDNATFLKWFKLVEQSWDAPDDAGWMRMNTGSCTIKGGGFVKNAQLSATYAVNMPGTDGCDERHSVPYATGKFVNAPGRMSNDEKKDQRCPPPMIGTVQLECRNGALYALGNSCSLRPGAPSSMATSRGYYKMLRGRNYHGIESGAAFAIAEMNRFADRCPTLSWTRFSECNVSQPCQTGVQHRTREPIGLLKTDPKCKDMMFYEQRSCVGPGFCPQVLTRFMLAGSSDIGAFQAAYKRASNTITSGSYATAGATMLSTSTPKCDDAKYWCRITTGQEICSMYMEGHFEVKKEAEYFLHYETTGGAGILEFNTLGGGSEEKPEFKVQGGASSSMYEWQDLGFHHRRRRSALKPWERIASLKLKKGTYYARMTRTGWTSCPDYKLRLEQLSAVYRPPMLLGTRGTAAALKGSANGGSQQKTTTWWNNWGAISSHTVGYREKGYSWVAPKSEPGTMNELVLRDENGKKIIKKVPITKFNFTADELYTLLNISKVNLPSEIGRYGRFELVIRGTVILPEKGDYVFKFMMDTSFDAKEQAWMQSNRRRQTKFTIRAGANPSTGSGWASASFSAYQGSGTKSVSYRANTAGTVPFEASIYPSHCAPGDKIVLPNSVLMELKKKDMLHGETIPIGTKTKYMSDMTAIRGDTQVRIDWPERDDPLSSELKTQTFKELYPQALLIGNKDMDGFQAVAEAKIDAGACTSVEAWASGVDKTGGTGTTATDFWGVGLNLCDVDGSTQFLELVTYHPPSAARAKLTNITKKRVGWVHIGFTQPTHMRIVRDPLDLGKFSFSYKPDNRASFATPFAPLQSGFTGKMEVGVSMNSAEAYRYAEFYNVSIEECPASCDAAGKQLFCGEVVTPCGNKLTCGKTCGGGDVCKDNMCMDCPNLSLTANQSKWQCGTITHSCTNHKKQLEQVTRDIGTVIQPSTLHFCNDKNEWFCVGQSKWAFLAEGKECGEVTDNCLNNVTLFPCPHTNDQCTGHKCKCTPTTFSQDNNCGAAADGCGKSISFGTKSGQCAGSTDVCNQHKCCTPKTRSDFSADFKCGKEDDGCGGYVSLNQAAGSAAFIKVPERTNYYWYNGQRGVEITAGQTAQVVKLARGLMEGTSKLAETSRVSIWDVTSKTMLGSVDVGPSASIKDRYAWENLATPVQIEKGKKYRIVQKVWSGMKDKFSSKYYHGSSLTSTFNSGLVSFQGLVQSSKSTEFPDGNTRSGQGVGIVNFDVLENGGCGSGLWTCHSNHSCTKKEVKGFLVESGPCVSDGNCVKSANFPSNYANREKCKISTPSAGTMTTKTYTTENYFDYLTIDGKQYRSGAPPTMVLTAPKSFTWSSDGSVTRKGFELCVGAGGGLTMAEEDASAQGEEDVVDEDNALEGLSEDEKQHALAKYQQRRDEDAAGEAAMKAAELEGEEERMAALQAESLAEEEVEGVELSEDELALPDLTQA